eukprot:2980972-Pyramimonas_sp.AAC.1
MEPPSASDVCEAVMARALDQIVLQTVLGMEVKVGSAGGLHSTPLQVVLLGTGLDTRTTRVPWPASTRIFDVCPEPAVALASLYLAPEHTTTERSKQRLYSPLPLPVPVESGEDVGFKTGVNGEGLSAQEAWTQGFLGNAAEGQLTMTLRSNGYRADCPSIWVFHGLHTLSSKMSKQLLSITMGLIDKQSIVIGEFPTGSATDGEELLAEAGLLPMKLSLEEVASQLNLDDEWLPKLLEDPCSTRGIFIAEKTTNSVFQTELFWDRVEAIERDGGEDGFDD